MAELISQRIDEITAACSVDEMIIYKIGRCHPLKRNRKNQFALDLIQPNRLVFEKFGEYINIVRIIEIVDYH